MEFINKIKENIISKTKLLIFILIFSIIVSIYNVNSQTLNFILKRGVILEYSINQNAKINKEEIRQKLSLLGIKYSLIKDTQEIEENEYDFDGDSIKKLLYIGLPYKADENKKELLNNISDFIFDNYKNSKLIQLRAMNDLYSKPYNTFVQFLVIFIISFIIWLILTCLIFGKNNMLNSIKTNCKSFYLKSKENILNYIKKTKENGFKYFLKRLLLDGNIDEKQDTNVTKEVINTIFIVILFVILIRFFIGELRWIPSGSMRPTILEHDRVFVEKLEYPTKEIKRGDILVFYPPEVQLSNSPLAIFERLSGIFCTDIAYIKRVVGMPNDKFEVKFNKDSQEYRVYINDKALNEPYISSRYDWTPCAENMYCGPFIIPENHYFMMGDNRGNSQDSRFWGFLDKQRVIGRANFMFMPVKRINKLNDKYLYLHKQKAQNGFLEYNYILNRYELLYII